MAHLGARARGVLDTHDIQVIRAAVHTVIRDHVNDLSEIDPNLLGRTVIRLYDMGLVDVAKLAEVAALMVMSRSSTCVLRSGTTKSST